MMHFLFLLSGMGALCCETVWLRRLSLLTGSAGMSAVLTLGLYMAGLGIGGWWAGKRTWSPTPFGYGILELSAAIWALLFPFLIHLLSPWIQQGTAVSLVALTLLLLPPACAHGATLPSLGSTVQTSKNIAGLYATNTFGAVLGVLFSSFWWMPTLGIRGTEIIAAGCSGTAGLGAILFALRSRKNTPIPSQNTRTLPVPPLILLCCTVAGFASMSLEILWSRLASLLIGGSVYSMAIVLTVFLLGIALGAEIGKRKGATILPFSLFLVGLLATLGTFFWPFLPHGLGIAWDIAGESSQLPAGALLLSLGMCGASIASGMVFGSALQSTPETDTTQTSGSLLFANTFGSVLGVFLCGTVGMPLLSIRGMVFVITILCTVCACLLPLKHKKWMIGTICALWVLSPNWDHAIYSVGIYNRIGSLNKHDPRYIDRYAHRGWTLEYYKDGTTASVAVGKSTRTGNLWLSINGKVDASTGNDMPTQLLSGELPVIIAHSQDNHDPLLPTLVVGLASGVTAAEARKTGVQTMDVLEIEPAVVEAAALFSDANHDILHDPHSMIHIQDARAFLTQSTKQYSVIISEPSNPWLTGVSNLFTVEYWRLTKEHLQENGVFCQWVQLYNMPPEGFQILISSFLSVYPNTWLFETIPGADVLLISAPSLPLNIPIPPTLGPKELQKLANNAPYNTDDRPWIEFEAPKWLNRPTGTANKALIDEIKRTHSPTP